MDFWNIFAGFFALTPAPNIFKNVIPEMSPKGLGSKQHKTSRDISHRFSRKSTSYIVKPLRSTVRSTIPD